MLNDGQMKRSRKEENNRGCVPVNEWANRNHLTLKSKRRAHKAKLAYKEGKERAAKVLQRNSYWGVNFLENGTQTEPNQTKAIPYSEIKYACKMLNTINTHQFSIGSTVRHEILCTRVCKNVRKWAVNVLCPLGVCTFCVYFSEARLFALIFLLIFTIISDKQTISFKI